MVLHDIRKRRDGYRYYIADPASQLVTYTETEMRVSFPLPEGVYPTAVGDAGGYTAAIGVPFPYTIVGNGTAEIIVREQSLLERLFKY